MHVEMETLDYQHAVYWIKQPENQILHGALSAVDVKILVVSDLCVRLSVKLKHLTGVTRWTFSKEGGVFYVLCFGPL